MSFVLLPVWVALIAAGAALLNMLGIPWPYAILTAWIGPPIAAGIVLWATGAISERRQPAELPGLEPVVRDVMQDAEGDIDRALTILCDPCNGREGTCKCTSNLLCENDDCPAPDTAVLSERDVRFLRSIGVSYGGEHG